MNDASFAGWSPKILFDAVNLTFPKLRELKIMGACETIEQKTPSDRMSRNAFVHSFFPNHPFIHTLEIDWVDLSFSPLTIPALFPALRHFLGPAYICTALIGSSLRSQIETLKMPNYLIDDRAIPEVADAITELPMLRELEYPTYCLHSGHSEFDGATIRPTALRKILSAAPRLRKLEFYHRGKVSTCKLNQPSRNLRFVKVLLFGRPACKAN